MQRRVKLLALVLCALVALSMAGSLAIMASAGSHVHTCNDRKCSLCRTIAQIGRTWRGYGVIFSVILWALILKPILRGGLSGVNALLPCNDTPVHFKTRIND